MGNGISIETLFKDLAVQIIGSKDLTISGICAHSKFVVPNNLFIAKKGSHFDASEFIAEAISAGATAILTDLYNPFLEGITQIIHPHPATLEPEIASRYFNTPSKELFLIGITGTNGKTTTSYLIHHLLHSKETPCGLMGTIEIITPLQRIPSQLTTSDVITNQKFLREMRDQGSKYTVMEVTSHALEQGRIQGLDFDIGIFTNFSQDHLDYHETMENYLAAKAKLFKLIDDPTKTAILNVDDPVSTKIFGNSEAKRRTYGIQKPADFKAENISMTLEGTHFLLMHEGKGVSFKTPLIGMFNISNVLAALAVGCICGLSFQKMQRKMESFPGVPGRLERIFNDQNIHLFVDFAHTPEALEKVLSILHQIKTGKIITIFGCGGDRDRKKRPLMARAVETLSDVTLVTSDNPRSEDPHEICKEIVQGFEKNSFSIEVDRKKAIEKGISLAKPGDIVLIAGRGHEPFQKIGGRFIPFDDREVAREIINSLTPLKMHL